MIDVPFEDDEDIDPTRADDLPTDASLRSVAEVAERLKLYENEIVDLTGKLLDAQRRYRQVAEVELPAAMRNAGTDGFTLADAGAQVRLVTRYDGKQLTAPAGLAYVEANGGSALIRTSIEVELDRGDLELAREVMQILRAHRGANSFKKLAMVELVPAQTMGAFARRLIEQGKDVPLKEIGVHRRTYAVVGSRPASVDLKGFKRG